MIDKHSILLPTAHFMPLLIKEQFLEDFFYKISIFDPSDQLNTNWLEVSALGFK